MDGWAIGRMDGWTKRLGSPIALLDFLATRVAHCPLQRSIVHPTLQLQGRLGRSIQTSGRLHPNTKKKTRFRRNIPGARARPGLARQPPGRGARARRKVARGAAAGDFFLGLRAS